MPSPIGHSLAGVIVAWTADLVPGRLRSRAASVQASWLARAGGAIVMACAVLAALADIDLLSPVAVHRAYTHSVGAVIVVTIITAGVTAWVTRFAGLKTGATKKTIDAEPAEPAEKVNGQSSATSALYVIRVALLCGAAYGSHVLLDWMAVDDTFPYGIRALWPFSSEWYISGWDIFPGTARRHVFSAASLLQNARAIGAELAILVPIAWGVWMLRAKALRHAERAGRHIAGPERPARPIRHA